jgi:hypothetical protein
MLQPDAAPDRDAGVDEQSERIESAKLESLLEIANELL